MWVVWIVIPLLLIGIVGTQYSFGADFSYDFGKRQIVFDGKNIDSVKTQLQKEIEPREIMCQKHLYLMYRIIDNSPICVKEYPSTTKLIQRGYATLGESSILLSTDKEVYSHGEIITITMTNNGDSLLLFSGAPNFYISDELGNSIDLPFDTIVPPVERITTFDTLASTTYVWNQTMRNLEQTNPGTYVISTSVGHPIIHTDHPSQLSYASMIAEKTFVILNDAESNFTKVAVDTVNQGVFDVEY